MYKTFQYQMNWQAANGLRYPRWGGRGQCSEAGKTQSQKKG